MSLRVNSSSRRPSGGHCTPVDPVQLVVLSIDVVVAVLGAAELIASEHHGRALREQQGCEQVALLPLTQRGDGRIGCRPFDAVIPRVIVVGSVAVVLAIRFVVFAVIGNEVVEIEAVMGGDEIHTRPGPAAALVEDVAGAGKPDARTPPSCLRRLSSRRARHRGICRSTRPSLAGSAPPGSRPAPHPRAPR